MSNSTLIRAMEGEFKVAASFICSFQYRYLDILMLGIGNDLR